MLKRVLSILALLLAVSGPVSADPVEDPAVAAAEAWLKLIDDKDYAASWAAASTLFQQGINQEAWVKQVSPPRAKLGALKSRKYQAFQQMTSLPGVPDGDYAVVSFDSMFENRAQATEVTTLVHEGKVWKVGGYFIK
jgi:hypothetical protein